MGEHGYETVIGLEIHVQLSTQSKAFCADDARFGGLPNTHIGWVSLGLPGTLPKVNSKAISFAAKLGLAMQCAVNQYSTFDRKNYFYADLPKGFQTTQDGNPICTGGFLNIKGKQFDLHHIHMEEDAGKSTHDQHPSQSLVDLNRAGVPLLEIVTNPVFRNGDEVSAFMEEIRRLVRWLDISDGNMEEGSLRCDVNISVKPKDQAQLGTRCEIKNMNSMRFARKAIAFESERQINILEKKGTVTQETRGFDPNTGTTFSLREKEDAHDYRYFPEPDLSPIILTTAWLDEVKQGLPVLPWVFQTRLTDEFGCTENDAILLTQEKSVAVYTIDLIKGNPKLAKKITNFVVNRILPWTNENQKGIDQFPLSKMQILELLSKIESGEISHTTGFQTVFPALLNNPNITVQELINQLNLSQNNDHTELSDMADKILAQFPDKVKEYKQGKKGLIGLFMGELMKASKGKADPKIATKILEEKLKK